MKSITNLLFLLISVAVITGCGDDDNMANPNPPNSPTEAFTYLALGDSYTIGTSVEEDQRWPRQLLDALLADRVVAGDPAPQLTYIATNGWRTDQLQAGIRNTDLAETYDLVSLLIGVNNQFQSRPLNVYQEEFTDLLNTAISKAGGDLDRVFVVSIPDYAFTPFGNGRDNISRGVDVFNAAAREITEAAGVPFYNITPISREGLRDPGLVASDDLHPSGQQYARWVTEVLLQPVAARINN